MKSAVWNVGPTNASKFLNSAIITVHTIPNQEAYGWNGACDAIVREGEVFHDEGLTNEPCKGEFLEGSLGLRDLGH